MLCAVYLFDNFLEADIIDIDVAITMMMNFAKEAIVKKPG